MKLSFDHLVHFVNNPIQAVEEMNRIGLHAYVGGNHEKWGTYNSLCYFGLSYIEFLGIRDKNKAEEAAVYHDLTSQAISLLPHTQGFNRIALRTDNIEEVAHHVRSLGLKTDGPIAGERKRDDGIILRWKMLFIEEDYKGLPLPFIIQWNQSDEERKVDLKEKINAHPIGKVEIGELVFVVRDIQETIHKWSRLFDLRSSEFYKDEELKASCIKLHLNGGNLTFAEPKDSAFLSDHLEKHGQGPFLLRLKGKASIPTKEIIGSYFQIEDQEH